MQYPVSGLKKLETAVELPTYGKYCSNEHTQNVTESAWSSLIGQIPGENVMHPHRRLYSVGAAGWLTYPRIRCLCAKNVGKIDRPSRPILLLGTG